MAVATAPTYTKFRDVLDACLRRTSAARIASPIPDPDTATEAGHVPDAWISTASARETAFATNPTDDPARMMNSGGPARHRSRRLSIAAAKPAPVRKDSRWDLL